MLRKAVYATALLFTLFGGAAMACEGQVGKVIFEDTFADELRRLGPDAARDSDHAAEFGVRARQ